MIDWLYTKEPLEFDDNVRIALSSELPDEYKTDKYLKAVCIIVHRLSNMPWYTQEQLIKEIELNKEELIKVNKVIRDSDYLQTLITKKGLGRKYWNTMSPFSNSTKSVINHQYQFPIRIAMFPGRSSARTIN